jgi:FolB domain-containing protein
VDWIELTEFRFDCVVGMLEAEQQTPQTLAVELKLGLDLEPAGSTGRLQDTVDYAAVADQVAALAQEGGWRLLETLAIAICRLLLAVPAPAEARAGVERVEVWLAKPDVLGEQATPAIRVSRDRDWCQLEVRQLSSGPGGGVDLEVLAEAPEAGAYRAHLPPGRDWQVPETVSLHVVAGGLSVDGTAVEPGHLSPRGAPRCVTNRGSEPASVLAVARPPLPVG